MLHKQKVHFPDMLTQAAGMHKGWKAAALLRPSVLLVLCSLQGSREGWAVGAGGYNAKSNGKSKSLRAEKEPDCSASPSAFACCSSRTARMDKPMETVPPALAPSRLQLPWLALPSKQRVLLKQMKLVGIPEQVGSQSEGDVCPCQAQLSRPKC